MFSLKYQLETAPTTVIRIAAAGGPAALSATDLFWNTNGANASWTTANWGSSAAGPFMMAWTDNKNVQFTADSLVTFATTSIGDVTIDDGLTVTITSSGTLSTNNAVRTFDVGSGSLLTWISQAVSNNSSSGFIKNGAGIWNIGAQANNYTGGFTLNAGTVIVSGNKSFGTAAMTINGGTIHSSDGHTFTPTSVAIGGNFAFAGTANDLWSAPMDLGSSLRTITNNTTASATRTFSGTMSGSGGIVFGGTGGSGGIVLSGANTYSGGTTVNGGLVSLFGSGTLGSTSGSLTVNGGTLNLGGTSQTVGALNGSGGTINTSTGASTLTMGTSGATGTYSGAITNGAGSVALTKTGSGIQTISGANSYTGATAINGGTLLINGNQSAATGAVTVTNSGSMLGGTGTIGGNVTVNSGARLQGGNGTAGTTLTLAGALTLSNASIIQLALGPSGLHSTLAHMGADGWTFDSDQAFTFINLGAQAGTYDNIIIGLNADPGTTGSWTITNPGFTGTFSYGGRNIDFNLTAVPEPSTWIAGALAMGVVGWSQRRRLFKKSKVVG